MPGQTTFADDPTRERAPRSLLAAAAITPFACTLALGLGIALWQVERELDHVAWLTLNSVEGFFDRVGEEIESEVARRTAHCERASAPKSEYPMLVRSFSGEGFECSREAHAAQDPGQAAATAVPAPASVEVSSGENLRPELLVTHRYGNGEVMRARIDPRELSERLVVQPFGASGATYVRFADDRIAIGTGSLNEVSTSIGVLSTGYASTRYGLTVGAIVSAWCVFSQFWLLLPLFVVAACALGAGSAIVAQRGWARRRSLLSQIRAGIAREEFVPFVQPVFELDSGRCIGGEVLARWRHPRLGLLAPARFVEAAERHGLIEAMTMSLVRQARGALAGIDALPHDFHLAFNVTPGQVQDRAFETALLAEFARGALRPAQVTLELIERHSADPKMSDSLARLRAHGFRIAIDDFGTGHSSLAYLESLPIDFLKIDRSFVATIGTDSVSRPVLDAIISLAERLRIDLVAEGIEEVHQAAYLEQRGVRCGQGYLYARPMPVGEFVAMLDASPKAHRRVRSAAVRAREVSPA